MVQIGDVEGSSLSLRLDIGLGTCGRLVPFRAAQRTACRGRKYYVAETGPPEDVGATRYTDNLTRDVSAA